MTFEVTRLATKPLTASDIPAALDDAMVEYTSIDTVCWPDEFPYQPQVQFRLAHCGDALTLHFKVSEQYVRSIYRYDNEAVWQDSCVEFFFAPTPQDGTYYNLECNCTGALLLGYGQPKRMGQRERATSEVTDLIERWSSLGREPIADGRNDTTWEIALLIPACTFFKHNIKTFDGMQATANLYKCGDGLPTPHYLAWQRIETIKPDFHRPEFFKELYLIAK